MKKEKTNMDYLYEFIKDNDEAKEFWESVSEELSDKDSEIEELDGEVKDLKNETKRLERDIPNLETLDFGFGKIEFVYPDNLKLQIIMEHLQENPEKLLQFE